MTVGSPPPRPSRGLRRPGRTAAALLAVAVAVVVVGAGFGLYEYVSTTNSGTTLVIYTYSSLLGGAECNPVDYGTVFGAFESAHHVHIDLVCPAGTLVSTLLAQANSPSADLVIGLDEITTPEAEAHHLLIPYAPPNLANVSPDLVRELSPDHGAVPYEYGYLAFDYSLAFANATSGAVERPTLPEFANNSTWARQLVTEDPSQDITGEEFLAWEVEYYETVLHRNWTEFWNGVKGSLPPPAPDWSTAFYSEFMDAPGQNQVVVSYSTDPAYAAYAGQSGQFNSTVAWWNGTEYGWRTIYGVGIVNGTHHLALDQEFENWFLGGTVQAEIPTNEWEYPANSTIPLPPVFDAAVPVGPIVPLNDAATPSAIASLLPGWVEQWLLIFS
jgi:thiamine transport system substrate-binding protein